jgi:intracellular septation protein
MNQLVRFAIEIGPLAAFFVANARGGLMMATAVFMAATVASLAASYVLERRVPVMPLVTGAFVLLFGGLTLWLADERFIKIKPTIVYLLFATLLLVSVGRRRNVLKAIMGSVLQLSDEGWRILSRRWAFFFLALAIVNELVWRSLPTDAWVSFKVFGILPLTLVFSALQVPLVRRYQVGEGASGGE